MVFIDGRLDYSKHTLFILPYELMVYVLINRKVRM